MGTLAVTDLSVGMIARPPAGPTDLLHPRAPFAEVTSVVHRSGWTYVGFADGTGYQPRTESGYVEVLMRGSRVAFAEGTPQYRANRGIVYVVGEAPRGGMFSVDAHGTPYVWLTDEATMDRPPSRRRTRTGYVASLTAVA